MLLNISGPCAPCDFEMLRANAIESYDLSLEEYEAIKDLGLQRFYGKQPHIRYHKGSGYIRETRYPGGSHVVGVAGEFAYARKYGLQINTQIYDTHGDFTDFGLVEVKTSAFIKNLDATLKMTKDKDMTKSRKNHIQALVLCRFVDGFLMGEDFARVDVIGWNPIERFKLLSHDQSYAGGPLNYVNHPEDLCTSFPTTHEELELIAFRDNMNILDILEFSKGCDNPLAITRLLNQYIQEHPLI